MAEQNSCSTRFLKSEVSFEVATSFLMKLKKDLRQGASSEAPALLCSLENSPIIVIRAYANDILQPYLHVKNVFTALKI